MKKNLLLLLVILILSGCSIERIDTKHFSDTMNKILSFNIDYQNKVSNGYEYYVPKGVVRIDSNSYNEILVRGKNTYYLYADVVSYYYKTKVDYSINKDAYYSSKITNNDKEGYIEITESKDNLYVQMFYNYAKIETYTSKKDLNQTVIDLSYILSSVKFNDLLLKKEYDSNNMNSKEEAYSLFEDKGKEGNFLEYIKEFDKYDGSKNEDTEESEIKVEENKTTSKSE